MENVSIDITVITGIAVVHYYYMRDYNLEFNESPTFFRYVDWILTVPLMCVEFYLLTKLEAKKSLLWKLIFTQPGCWYVDILESV